MFTKTVAEDHAIVTVQGQDLKMDRGTWDFCVKQDHECFLDQLARKGKTVDDIVQVQLVARDALRYKTDDYGNISGKELEDIILQGKDDCSYTIFFSDGYTIKVEHN